MRDESECRNLLEGLQIFIKKNINMGKVVQRYNVSMAEIEYYFVPTINLHEYSKAKEKQDLNADMKYGNEVKFS